MRKGFDQTAKWTARQAGRPATFVIAVGLIVLWAASGPILSWSDTWMLLVNTGTTVITFLMVLDFRRARTATPTRSSSSWTS